MKLTPTERLAILADAAADLERMAAAQQCDALKAAAGKVADALQAARELVTEDETED